MTNNQALAKILIQATWHHAKNNLLSWDIPDSLESYFKQHALLVQGIASCLTEIKEIPTEKINQYQAMLETKAFPLRIANELSSSLQGLGFTQLEKTGYVRIMSVLHAWVSRVNNEARIHKKMISMDQNLNSQENSLVDRLCKDPKWNAYLRMFPDTIFEKDVLHPLCYPKVWADLCSDAALTQMELMPSAIREKLEQEGKSEDTYYISNEFIHLFEAELKADSLQNNYQKFYSHIPKPVLVDALLQGYVRSKPLLQQLEEDLIESNTLFTRETLEPFFQKMEGNFTCFAKNIEETVETMLVSSSHSLRRVG